MSDLLGVVRDFEFQGGRYKVAPAGLHVLNQFCNWVAAEAGRTLACMKYEWPAEFYAEQMRLFNSKIVGKKFSWGQEDVNNALMSEDACKHMLWLKITYGQERGGQPIDKETIEELSKNKAHAAKWQELTDIYYEEFFPDFFAKLKEEREMAKKANLPQSPAPAKA